MTDAHKALKRKLSTAKGQFTRRLNNFNKESVKEDADVEALHLTVIDIEKSYAEVETKQADLLDELKSDDEEDKKLKLTTNADSDSKYEQLCTARKTYSEMKKKSEPDKSIKQEGGTSQASASKYDLVKVKKLDAPVFDGNIRNYPNFRRSYETYMLPVHGKDPYALKGSLQGEALELVQGLYDDYDEMMTRLDTKYGCTSKLVDSVISDLEGLKGVPDGNHKKFLELIEVIEKSWLDLKNMNLEAEMNTSLMISRIEKLLPSVQKRDWTLLRQNLVRTKSPCTFQNLLQFLKAEREAIEYMNVDLRSVSLGACSSSVNTTEQQNYKYEGDNEIQNLKEIVQGLVQVVKGNTIPNQQQQGQPTMNCWLHATNSHDILNCNTFCSLDPQTRTEEVRKYSACFLCLQVGHISRRCDSRISCTATGNDGKICGKRHHTMLHRYAVQGSSSHGEVLGRGRALLMVSVVTTQRGSVTVLWDPGANISLITHIAARRLGLKGVNTKLCLTKVGNTCEIIYTKEYTLSLIDQEGKTWVITLFGMEAITGDQPEVDMNQACKIFNLREGTIKQRPKGKIDVLIGTDWCKILPNKVDERDNLQLMRNQFGYCVRGSHPDLKVISSNNNYHVQIHSLNMSPINPNDIYVAEAAPLTKEIKQYLEIESLNETVNDQKCEKCKCGPCASSDNCTLKGERELRLINEGLTLDTEKKVWTVKYPWIRSPSLLPNNYTYALARMKAQERKLLRKGKEYAEKYNEALKEMIRRNDARMLTPEELKEAETKPVYYMPHHDVEKVSDSTPIRVVMDASATYMGSSINDYWAKGPNMLSNLLVILCRFRQYKIALVADIKKMYNSIRLSKEDQNVHRFLWRWMKMDADVSQFIHLTVPFGDKPGGAIAGLALKRTAEKYREECPIGAEVVLRNMFVDDALKSVETEEIAKKVVKELEKVAEYGGFKIKHWIISTELIYIFCFTWVCPITII
jgi:hypothetical protein